MLQVYLADLTHMGKGIASESFPLNIGLVASFAKKNFGKDAHITLFKDPYELLDAIKHTPPNILGCSNYTWNSNLSYQISSLAKQYSPETLTLWGGTNYPFDEKNQEKFLRRRKNLDIHIFYEGEQGFSEVIERALSVPAHKILSEPINGCQFISPSDSSFVSGDAIDRIMDLDSIQSPYTSGLLDKFFDGVMTPLVETARGCPFLCNFCNAGDDYFNRVHKFSDDYVKEELTYIAKKCSDTGGGHVTFADNNFGMIPRDALTVKVVNDLQQKYAWPKTMTVWTGKNSKKRVIEATRTLGKSLGISMSVQSMDPEVLKNIKRDNINIDDYTAVAQELNNQGRPQHAELILPLPGETFQSHFDATLTLLDSQVSHIGCHTITMLFGTPYKDDEAFREKNGYVTKYRLVVKNFSTIDKTPIFDVEEVGIATKDMTFSEYVKARKFHYIIDLCLNSHNFDVMHRYLLQNKIKLSNWMQLLFEKTSEMPDAVKNIIMSFEKETIDELWDSEEEMIAYFSKPENYKKLVDGERGNNVMFRHRVWMLSIEPELFVSSICKYTLDIILESVHKNKAEQIEREMKALETFIIGTTQGCHSQEFLDKTLNDKIEFDVMAWLESPKSSLLLDFALKEPTSIFFSIEPEGREILRDGFERYGQGVDGMVKLIQRVGRSPIRVASLISPSRNVSI